MSRELIPFVIMICRHGNEIVKVLFNPLNSLKIIAHTEIIKANIKMELF